MTKVCPCCDFCCPTQQRLCS